MNGLFLIQHFRAKLVLMLPRSNIFTPIRYEEINQLTNQNIDLKKFDFKNVDLFQSKSIHAFPDLEASWCYSNKLLIQGLCYE